MFYALSKLLVILFYPLTWIAILITIALVTKKTARRWRLLLAIAIVTYLFSNTLFFNLFAKAWDVTSYPPPGTTYSCAIVLGGFASEDEDGQGFFNGSADRFIQAIKLQKQGRVKKIMISSGASFLAGYKWNEADYVASQLRALGFADSTFLIENKSRNTFENAVFSKPILIKNGVKPPYLLVTSAFHMRRAMYTFKKAGIDVVPNPCDYIAGKEKSSLTDAVLPNASTLYKWNLYIKEVVGMLVYRIKPLR